MWLFTTDGFYSSVAHRDDDDVIIVRCRAREDADNLVAALGAGRVDESPSRDYRFRVQLARETWARYVAQAAETIDYPNFKDAVAERQGMARAHVYSDVWVTLRALQPR